ncbi:MAG: DUF1697 domain-containing protein [Devosia sp.]|nr:DUF1697 domain-containing protein [Devosia sp.]
MAVHVVLIRAIGPVTHAKMRMAALRAALNAAGLADVVTVGNTGNVILRSPKRPAGVRALVEAVVSGFGLGPANEVFVRTPAEMAAVVAADPFPAMAASRPADLGVCSFHAAPDWTPLGSYDGPEQTAVIGSHLVVAYPDGATASRLAIEKLLGARMTMRNWRVFAGLAARAAAP